VAGANSHSNGDGIHGAESGRMGSMQGQVGGRQLFRQHFGSLQHLIITTIGYCCFFHFLSGTRTTEGKACHSIVKKRYSMISHGWII
jgi:hypothetical protein